MIESAIYAVLLAAGVAAIVLAGIRLNDMRETMERTTRDYQMIMSLLTERVKKAEATTERLLLTIGEGESLRAALRARDEEVQFLRAMADQVAYARLHPRAGAPLSEDRHGESMPPPGRWPTRSTSSVAVLAVPEPAAEPGREPIKQ